MKGVDKSGEEVDKSLTSIEKKRIGAIFIASGFSIIFWIFWYLAYLPVYYYWADNMDWVIAGYQVPSTWFDAGNSLFCVILAPVMAALWVRQKTSRGYQSVQEDRYRYCRPGIKLPPLCPDRHNKRREQSQCALAFRICFPSDLR